MGPVFSVGYDFAVLFGARLNNNVLGNIWLRLCCVSVSPSIPNTHMEKYQYA